MPAWDALSLSLKWRSTLAVYEPEYTRHFLKDLKGYPSLKKRIADEIQAILNDPYATSELLAKKRVDWRGKRSQRLTRNFRIIFTVCEECQKRGFRKKGYNACEGCVDISAAKSVVFLAFGPHNVYEN